jgi:hypothetical protein
MGGGYLREKSLAPMLFLILLAGIVSPLSAEEEYWRDFFYLIDNKSYDKAPLFYHPLTEKEAKSMGNYTVVFLDPQGRLKEALTYQSRDPLYYYFYYYGDISRPQARFSYYFQDRNRAVKSNLVYYYYSNGTLIATSYFEYSLLSPGEKIRSFTKIYQDGEDPVYLDQFELSRQSELKQFMEESERVVDRAMKDFRGGELFIKELSN